MATTVKTVTLGLSTTITKVLGDVWKRWTDGVQSNLPLHGNGAPGGVVIANAGTIYCDDMGGVGAGIYIKEDVVNDGTAVGWRAL